MNKALAECSRNLSVDLRDNLLSRLDSLHIIVNRYVQRDIAVLVRYGNLNQSYIQRQRLIEELRDTIKIAGCVICTIFYQSFSSLAAYKQRIVTEGSFVLRIHIVSGTHSNHVNNLNVSQSLFLIDQFFYESSRLTASVAESYSVARLNHLNCFFSCHEVRVIILFPVDH